MKELSVISPKRELEKPRRADIRKKKRNTGDKRKDIIIAGEAIVITVMAVMIYILQAGPI